MDLARVRQTVDTVLGDFLTAQENSADSPHLTVFTGMLRDMLGAGGKRLRPLLCYLGWRAAGGTGDATVVVHVAASLELFHVSALIHDDVMDGSDLRRGRPSAHRVLSERHSAHPTADRLGVNTAILLGNLALGWSYELMHRPAVPFGRMARVWSLLNAMRVETLVGQYLDLLDTGRPTADADRVLAAIRGKTARYTVERPLQLGALLAGANQRVLSACTAYGLPLGEAFQLRDDLLGVFGDPVTTGKSRLDDLRQGKATMLLATALRLADAAQTRRLCSLVGDPALDEAGAAEVRDLILATGAATVIERMIAHRHRQAMHALAAARFDPEITGHLYRFAELLIHRDR